MVFQQQCEKKCSRAIQLNYQNPKARFVDNRSQAHVQKKIIDAIQLTSHVSQAKFIEGETVEGLNSQEILEELRNKGYDTVTIDDVEQLKKSSVQYSTLDEIYSFFSQLNKKSSSPPPPPPPPPPQPTKVETKEHNLNIDALFHGDMYGHCEFDPILLENTGEQELMLLYNPSGEKKYVSKGHLQCAIKDYHWTTNPPRKATPLFKKAEPVEFELGVGFLFKCWKCKSIIDTGDECDWVVHDVSECKAANILCFGDSHTHRSQNFKLALNELKSLADLLPKNNILREEAEQRLLTVIEMHEDAAKFYGFDIILDILKKKDAVRWQTIKNSGKIVYIHDHCNSFFLIMDYILL